MSNDENSAQDIFTGAAALFKENENCCSTEPVNNNSLKVILDVKSLSKTIFISRLIAIPVIAYGFVAVFYIHTFKEI